VNPTPPYFLATLRQGSNVQVYVTSCTSSSWSSLGGEASFQYGAGTTAKRNTTTTRTPEKPGETALPIVDPVHFIMHGAVS